MTFNRNHDQKCGTRTKGYPGRPKVNDSWRANSVAWAKHVMHCSNICGQATEHWSEGTDRKWPQIHYKNSHYWWWILGLWMQTWHQAAIISVEDATFTATQKSTSFWIQQKSPLNSSDLAPCDLFLFPKMKLKFKRQHSESIDELQDKV